MFKILSKKVLSENVKQIIVHAPDIAKRAKAGQFIILRANEKGERIPLTIAGTDPDKGTVTIIFQEIGKTTMFLGTLNEGDSISDLLGPLGHPTETENIGKIVAIGGGVGVAEILPVARAYKNSGKPVI